jgi:hypothetical protein
MVLGYLVHEDSAKTGNPLASFWITPHREGFHPRYIVPPPVQVQKRPNDFPVDQSGQIVTRTLQLLFHDLQQTNHRLPQQVPTDRITVKSKKSQFLFRGCSSVSENVLKNKLEFIEPLPDEFSPGIRGRVHL